jgi:hypothetical protein
MSNSKTHDREEQDAERDQQTDEPDTTKDDGPPAPFAPDPDDDSALGDTDEHSDA